MLNSPKEVRNAMHMLESYRREAGDAEGDAVFYEETWAMLRAHETDLGKSAGLRYLFEGLVPDGAEYLKEVDFSRRRNQNTGIHMTEASYAVDTSVFTNIIGQITYSAVLDALDTPDFIGQSLVTTTQATTQQVEIIPGISKIGDVAEDVGEGEEYPIVGVSEEYITAPRKVKDGFILPVTEEAIAEDKTGMMEQRLAGATEALAITWEREILDTCLGVTTSYSRNGGSAQATYAATHTEGTFSNLQTSTALVDYTEIETASLLWDDITDPNTGDPVTIGGSITIVVPTALEMTALKAISGTIEQGAIDANTPRTITANPLTLQTRRNYSVLTSQWVKDRTNSNDTWFIGNFPGAFQYREVFPLQLNRADRNSEAGFSRDIVTQLKVRRKGAPAVIEPRKVIKVTA